MNFDEKFPSMRNVKGFMYSFISKSPEVQEAIIASCLDKQRVAKVIESIKFIDISEVTCSECSESGCDDGETHDVATLKFISERTRETMRLQ